MMEWALIAVMNGKAEVVAMAEKEFDCWVAAAEAELPEEAEKGCFKLVNVLENTEQKPLR